MYILWKGDVIHNPHTLRNTARTIFSPALMGPMAASSLAAKRAALGVRVMLCGFSRMTSGGINASEQSPGTKPARNQLIHVTG